MAAYVTDTHALVWYAGGRYKRLSRTALRLFELADRERAIIYVPAAVVWEVGLLSRARRIAPVASLALWAETLFSRPGFELSPLDPHVLDAAVSLTFTDDLFDSAITATALTKKLALITKDARIAESGLVEIAW